MNRQLKFRRDEVEAAVNEAEFWVGRAPGVVQALSLIRDILKLDEYSDPSANYNAEGVKETSQEAAWKNEPRSGTQRRRALEALARTPMTDEALERHLRIPSSSARTRRAELVAGGWVMDSGQRRLTKCGNDAIVWTTTSKAYGLQITS